jgi:hypothetical protein
VCALHNLFRLVDLRRYALEGSPPHPLGFFDVLANAARGPELVPKPEKTPRSPLMGAFALAGICESVSLTRGELARAVRQVEFGGPSFPSMGRLTTTAATEGLRGSCEVGPSSWPLSLQDKGRLRQHVARSPTPLPSYPSAYPCLAVHLAYHYFEAACSAHLRKVEDSGPKLPVKATCHKTSEREQLQTQVGCRLWV